MKFTSSHQRTFAAALSLLVLVAALPPKAPGQAGVPAQPTAAKGNYHALVIGNNTYTSLPKLKTAEADAREVERLLRDDYGFRTKLLLNATRQQIVSALASYRRVLSPEDSLLVYYAGHGINDREAGRAYWLPVDAARDDYSNWISADDITAGIRSVPAKHVLVIADSCYSGTLTRGIGEALPRPTEREQFIKRMLAGKSRTLMASDGDEPVADGGGDSHSVFAGALIRGLREIDRGQFTAAELFRSYMQERVAGTANQTPEYNPIRNSGHEAGDFVFVKIRAAAKKAEAPTAAPRPSAPAFDPAAIELSFWESIKSSTDPDDFRDYLKAYPGGRSASLAQRREAALKATGAAKVPAGAPSTAPPSSPAARPSPSPGGDGAGLANRPAAPKTASPTTGEAALRAQAAEAVRRSHFSAAAGLATRALLATPSDAVALRLRSEALDTSGESGRAAADAAQVLRLLARPSGAEQYEARCFALFMKGEYDRALADCGEAIRLDPGHVFAYVTRARVYRAKGEDDIAVADCTDAIRLDPRYATAYFIRGVSYAAKKDYGRAIADYTEAIRLDPSYAGAYSNRGIAYGKKGDHERAIADYTEAIRLEPQDAAAYNNRCARYIQKGDYDRAIADCTQAIRIDPSYAGAYNNRSIAYENKGDRARAAADLRKAKEFDQ